MRLKQLAVGKIEEAGRALGRAGSMQVLQVGGYVRGKCRVHQWILLVADVADVCLGLLHSQ